MNGFVTPVTHLGSVCPLRHGHVCAVRPTRFYMIAETERRPGAHKGFVEEMRFVAMRLHTKDQSREGMMETSALPIQMWSPARADFMQFLVDSRAVYRCFEEEFISEPLFKSFVDTGLERVQPLNEDIEYLASLGVEEGVPSEAALGYVEYLRKMVTEAPEKALCHWYNYYFAHTAGGLMIGRLMQDKLFDGREFKFYQFRDDKKVLLNNVRKVIDEVAAPWSRQLKDECLEETGLAFGYSGTVLQNLAKAADK